MDRFELTAQRLTEIEKDCDDYDVKWIIEREVNKYIDDQKNNPHSRMSWLFSHCRALGLTEQSNAIPKEQRIGDAGFELDIALFVDKLVKRIQELEKGFCSYKSNQECNQQ